MLISSPYTGLDFRKKNTWGQLAPKFLDLVASTNFVDRSLENQKIV